MKIFTRTYLFAFVIFCGTASKAQIKFPLFDSTWYGFNTGSYPTGQSPSAVKAADLDNDGDPDLVVSQENFSNGFVALINLGKGQYSAPYRFNSTGASKDIVVADFNNDGLKDVALSNTGQNFAGNSVAVYINKNHKGFKPPVYLTVGGGPVGLVAVDLDNDGDIDLAAGNYRTNAVSILENKGNGSFNAAVNFPAGLKPFKITAGKLNKDSLPDIVVANEGGKVNVLYNGGSNNFSDRVEMNSLFVSSGDIGSNVEVADIDNDGDNDILYSSQFTSDGSGGIVALFKNKGNGNFLPFQSIHLNNAGSGSVDINIADMNNDGWKDIVCANYSGRTTDGYEVVLNDRNGNFIPSPVKPGGQSTYGITTADVDNDKKIDVITVDWYSLQVTVHKNFGNANFPVPALYNTDNIVPGALDAADIDGDGDLDVVTSASSIAAIGITVTVLKNNGDGSFANAIAYSIRGGGVRAKFRDLNGDGKPDLLFATAISSPPYDFHTAINNGDGTFGPRQTWSMNACGWNDIDAADLDNDGDLDVVITEWLGCQDVINSARRIFISKNNGHGVFSAPLIKVVNPFPGSIATGDFNEDGKIDLVTGQSPGIDLHRGTGTGDLLPPVSFATQKAPYTIMANDFNNDGHLDVAACTEYNSEGMSVLLGNGNGTFQPAQNYDGAYSPDLRNESGITSGDIDDDGDIDIIVGNTGSNDVSVYLNNSDGTFVFRMRYGIYYGVASPIYADFTGDGKGDILAKVSLPPSGIGGAIALIKGRAPVSITKKTDQQNKIEKDNVIANEDLRVLNNPFTNYIDVKFEKIPPGKITLRLTELTGQTLASSGFKEASQIVRFDLSTIKLHSGIYLLTAEMASKRYTIKVIKQ